MDRPKQRRGPDLVPDLLPDGAPTAVQQCAESPDFHRRAAAKYDQIAEADPGRFPRLDATADPDRIHQQVMRRVSELL